MKQETAVLNLLGITGIIEKMQKRYFLVDGTLLGAVREGKMIEWDTDLDIGVMAGEWTTHEIMELCKRAIALGIMPYHFFGNFQDRLEISFWRGGVKLDVFFYRLSVVEGEPAYIYHAFLNGGRDLARDTIYYWYPASMIGADTDRKVTLERVDFFAPAEPEKVLEHKYGDWKTPVKKWDWARGPKNVLSVGDTIATSS